jgi:hypothetical protein
VRESSTRDIACKSEFIWNAVLEYFMERTRESGLNERGWIISCHVHRERVLICLLSRDGVSITTNIKWGVD